MSLDIELPAFALDCREWLVARETDGVLGDEICAGPVLAVLSTVVIENDAFYYATAVISLALLGDDDRNALGNGVGGFQADLRLSDVDWDTGNARYFAPAPNASVALMAEFSSEPNPPLELTARFHELLASFRWAA